MSTSTTTTTNAPRLGHSLPILHGSARSPFVRKVRTILACKQIAYEWSTDYYGFLQQVNPLGKVPVWVGLDGNAVYDSRVICEYLELLEPQPAMLPSDPHGRIRVKQWEALADGICDAAVAVVVEHAREIPAERSAAWIDKQQGKVMRGLATAQEHLGGAAWCHGGKMSLADAALGAALGYVSFRLPELQWKSAHPELARYLQALNCVPAFSEAAPK